MHTNSVLIVDDDIKIRTLLRNVLEGDGMRVFEAATAKEAYKTLSDGKIDLITLDLHLGSDDGFEIARTLRKTSQIPIMMLTGKDDVIDKIVGLEIGADDYVTKPFHVREVLARVKSILRRVGEGAVATSTPPDASYIFDGFRASPDLFELRDKMGDLIEITSGDFRLLTVFLKNSKRVLSRDQLMDMTGGVDWTPLDRTIDNQVARLRKKIETDPSTPQLIKTVRGIGYTFTCSVQKT